MSGTLHCGGRLTLWGERAERQLSMARLFDSDCDVSASTTEADLRAQIELPPLPLDDLLSDPAVRERIGMLISEAMRRSVKAGY